MFYNKEINEIKKELKTTNKGLSLEEVKNRQLQYGKNVLPKKKKDSILNNVINLRNVTC